MDSVVEGEGSAANETASVARNGAPGVVAASRLPSAPALHRLALRFPSLVPRFGDRTSALYDRVGVLVWLYVLVPVPLVTDWIENGALPSSPRGWITELLGGLVIALLISRVRRDRRALEALARRDGLTGLFNRRTFEAAIEAECARARRSREPLSVVYLDIDRFKAINDRFGHGAGDQVLRQLAAAIGATIRTHVDSAYRLGGDEFALLLPSTTKEQAEAVVRRLRSFCAVHDPRWAVGAFDLSAGIVDFEGDEAASTLLARSDAAMYAEKNARRAALH
jgi:diguanylate cyclase (GGDEF)-like protein